MLLRSTSSIGSRKTGVGSFVLAYPSKVSRLSICKDLDISSASCSVFKSSSRISFFFSSGKFAIAAILLLISFWSLAESFAQ